MFRQDFHAGKTQSSVRNQMREKLWRVFTPERWNISSQGLKYAVFYEAMIKIHK